VHWLCLVPLTHHTLRYVASYTIERFGRSLDYSGQYKISVAVNGFSIPGSPFSSPACVGFEYHPRIFAHEGLHLVGTATYVRCPSPHRSRIDAYFRYENAQGRTAENAQTPAGGVVRLVHGASTTNSPQNQAGAMWFAELMPVGEGFVIEFEFQLSDALLHCRVTSPTQVGWCRVNGCVMSCLCFNQYVPFRIVCLTVATGSRSSFKPGTDLRWGGTQKIWVMEAS
jgi:hypothetical protein